MFLTLEMVQPANRIIDTLGLKDDRQHDMPADPNVKLHKDKDGLPRTDEWHYRSLKMDCVRAEEEKEGSMCGCARD